MPMCNIHFLYLSQKQMALKKKHPVANWEKNKKRCVRIQEFDVTLLLLFIAQM